MFILHYYFKFQRFFEHIYLFFSVLQPNIHYLYLIVDYPDFDHLFHFFKHIRISGHIHSLQYIYQSELFHLSFSRIFFLFLDHPLFNLNILILQGSFSSDFLVSSLKFFFFFFSWFFSGFSSNFPSSYLLITYYNRYFFFK